MRSVGRASRIRGSGRVLERTLGTLAALGLMLAAGGCEPRGAESDAEATAPKDEIAIIGLRGGGEIRIRFFPNVAPRHVENFKTLARQGFYDGTTFHRVIPGFMIQGGDPNTKDDDPTNDGTGNSGHFLKAEFSQMKHRRGILSMARASHPDSASSQFFIMLADAPTGTPDWSQVLDGKYSIFGEVIEGMDVVDAIADTPRDIRDRPEEDQVMERVWVEGG